MTTKAKQLARCGTPAGGCGFRGRDWRRGQIVASFGSDGTMYCQCGSEMQPLKKTHFEIVRCQKSPRAASSEQMQTNPSREVLEGMTYAQWLDYHRAQPGGWLVLSAPDELLYATYKQRLVTFDEMNNENP